MGSVNAAGSPEKSALELLQDFKATGSQQSFEEIVRRYGGMVFHVCLKVTKNAHDAEDATQAVFLTLAVQAKTAREIRYVGPWLQQVAHRVALDMRKSKSRRQLREEQHGAMAQLRSDPSTNGNGAHALDVQELNGLVGEELNKLPPKYRLPMILHYYGGLSREAMAKELNCKPATLGVRLHRAREMLGKRLTQRGILLAEAAMATSLVCFVRSSISDTLVASTCQAASSLVAGRDLHAGLVSAQVVGMARNAVRAALLAKLKLAGAVVLAAGTALAAGAEVVARIHPMDLKFNLDLGRLIRPLFEPLLRPSYSRTPPASPAPREMPNLKLADSSLSLPGESGGLWTSWSAGTVEGTPPVYIAPTTPPPTESSAASGASRPAATLLQSLLNMDRPVVSANTAPVNRPPAGSLTMVLGGQPAPLAARQSAPPRANTSFSAATTAALSARGDPPASSQIAPPAPVYSWPLVTSARIPMAGNVPIGPYAASTNIVLPPSPQPPAGGADAQTAGITLPSTSTNPPAHGTIYLDPAPSPLPSGPASLAGATLDSGISGNATTFQSLATTATYSMAALANAASPTEPRTIAHITGTTLLASSDALDGFGTVGPAEAFDQNGRVIADGQGTPQTLDLSQVGMILNSVDNSPTRGTNGWFARNAGKLVLPPLQVNAGSGTYTWGEDAADPGLDLVNSLRLVVKNAGKPAKLSVALLSPDRPDYPPVPTIARVLDVWQFNFSQTPGCEMAVTLRYDDAAVTYQGLSEPDLTLWRFDHGWNQVQDSLVLDTSDKTISGRVDSLLYLALAAPEIGSIETPEGLSNDSAGQLTATVSPTLTLSPSTVTTPEPEGMLMVAAAMLLLGRRRRR